MTQDLRGMNKIMKEMYLPGDARSLRGILARGKNVYKGMSHGANPKKLGKSKRIRKAAQSRIGKS